MYRPRRARKNVKYTYAEGEDVEKDIYSKTAATRDDDDEEEEEADEENRGGRGQGEDEGEDEEAPVKKKKKTTTTKRARKGKAAATKKKAKKEKKQQQQQQEEEEEVPHVSSLAALSAEGEENENDHEEEEEEECQAPAPKKAKSSSKPKKKSKKKSAAAENASAQQLAELGELREATERLLGELGKRGEEAAARKEAERAEREAREEYVAELEAQLEALRSGSDKKKEEAARAAELAKERKAHAKAAKANEFFKEEVKALHAKVRDLEKQCERLDELDQLQKQVGVYQVLTATRVQVLSAEEAAEQQDGAEADGGEAAVHARCKSVHRRYRRVVEYDLTLRDDELDYNPRRLDVEEGVEVPDFLSEPISFAPTDASIFFKNMAVMLQRQPAQAAAAAEPDSGAGEEEE